MDALWKYFYSRKTFHFKYIAKFYLNIYSSPKKRLSKMQLFSYYLFFLINWQSHNIMFYVILQQKTTSIIPYKVVYYYKISNIFLWGFFMNLHFFYIHYTLSHSSLPIITSPIMDSWNIFIIIPIIIILRRGSSVGITNRPSQW